MADKNYQSYWGEEDLIVSGVKLPPDGVDPKDYSDILKFSVCEMTLVDGCHLLCGTENCSDAVRGSRYTWRNTIFEVKNPSFGALTIKGAIHGWTLTGCDFAGHGKEFDVEIGQYDDYWYPGRPPTSNGLIDNCTSRDGNPILVQVWDGTKPVVQDSNVKIVKIPWIIWFPYFMFKYLKRKFL